MALLILTSNPNTEAKKTCRNHQFFYRRMERRTSDVEDYHQFLTTYAAYLDVEKPTFFDNLQYLFDFQMGYMYWRYFMWNFSGRQNDLQGKLDPINGNWISGFSFIDNWRLGPQDNLPSELANNKGKNKYYMLPLLFGVLGFAFLYRKTPNDFG